MGLYSRCGRSAVVGLHGKYERFPGSYMKDSLGRPISTTLGFTETKWPSLFVQVQKMQLFSLELEK